jgi:AraC-like DNA-binding protein
MYLKDPNLSLTEIAFLLGYSEQSAFTRAFRGWQGESPGSYRSKT